MPRKFIFPDVETTGKRPVEKYGIIQLAGVVCHEDDDGRLIEVVEFDYRMRPWPKDAVDPEALAISHQTLEQIAAYPDPKAVHARFVTFLGNQVSKFNPKDKLFFVGYNANFDLDYLRSWFVKAGDEHFGSWFWTPAVDVMSLAMQHLLAERPTMPNFQLGTVAAQLGVPLEQAHDALHDARATKAIYEICTGRPGDDSDDEGDDSDESA